LIIFDSAQLACYNNNNNYYYYYYYYIRLLAFFQENLGKLAPKGKIILNFTGARDDGWQWHQLDHIQIICTLLHR